jgi:hypothetical protein
VSDRAVFLEAAHHIECDEHHVYRVDGDVVPGVSEILKASGFGDPAATASGYRIDEDVIANAAERGIYIHEAIHLLLHGRLDWESLDEEIEPYVRAFDEWQKEAGFYAVATEAMFYEPEHGYCGTRDLFGYIGDEPTVVDIKTGSAGLKPWHKYQLAAYAYPNKGAQWPNRIMLHLKKDGKCKPHVMPLKKAEWDFKVFQACLTIWAAKELDRK